MKIIEENLLKNTILQLNKYIEKNQNMKEIYENISTLTIDSLQNFSFQKDNEFFDEVSFILSVINSIIAHPHISNKQEEVILRSDQAGHISSDAFLKTMKDHALWKEKDYTMVPEYVHYHQSTDELKIYENVFVGMLVDLIDDEISKYNDFYINLIPSLNNYENEILEDDLVEISLKRLDALNRKIKHIKNTYFYKEVSKVNFTNKKIQPTNILLKNRLYHFCFKFYKKFIQYEDKVELQQDFTLYYYMLLLKIFKEQNFIFNSSGKNKIVNNCYSSSYIYDDYLITLESTQKAGILLEISLKDNPSVRFKHQLILDANRTTSNEFKNIEFNNEQYTTCFFATIWNVFDSKNLNCIFNNKVKEIDIARFWMNNYFHETLAKKSIYQKYCPICKNKNVNEENSIYECTNCKTIYTFKPNSKKDTIWFINLRR